MLKKVLFFFILFISSDFFATPIYAGTVDAPALKCISVNSNGNVILNWTIPNNTGGSFESYHIYVASNANGPYSLLDSVFSYTQASYTDVRAKSSAPLYYYVKTRFNNPGLIYSNTSDTLRTILLDVSNSSNETASLLWNTPQTIAKGNSGAWYRIQREYLSNIWSLFDSTQNLNYIDTIAICSSSLKYKIEIADASGCTSISSINGSQDNTVPATPTIDSVSVDSSGNAIIGWTKNQSKDVKGYFIYQLNDGFWTPLDTVFGINSTSYTNTKSTAGVSSEKYRIAAFDNCNNTSPLGDIHNSIFVTSTSSICNAENILTWNSYNNMLDIAGYNIYVSVNGGGSFNMLATNAANNTTYKHTGLIPLTNYCYLVQAFNSSGTKTASSNQLFYFANLPKDPMFIYLKTATVKAENNVEISCFVDTAADVIQYKILRAESESGFYTKIDSIAASSTPFIAFTDLTAKTDSKSYYYKLVAVDSCGNDKITSNIGRTILLKVTENDDMTNTLYWNDYGQWSGRVSSYNIYRAVDGVFNPVPVANIPYANNGNNSFIDDISNYAISEGVFSYYVEAVEGSGNSYSFLEISRSNIAEVLQYPNFFVPNAFAPSGINTIFIPKGGFFDKSEYEFYVFNRWGEKIFGTNNFSEGWNGLYKDKEVETGVYVYWIKFKTSKGKYIEKSGSVTLIR